MRYLFLDLFSKIYIIDLKCDTCNLIKSHRVLYPISLNKCNVPFALVSFDVWGPLWIASFTGIRLFVTFIDDCTRMIWLYLLKNKSKVFDTFKYFYTTI